MLTIHKITANSTVDFAAEELKKYLRMMMPNSGDIKIAYAPEARDGFRLGLMSDFGFDTSDVKNIELDDLLYINTTSEGGIIAGDNPRSVLMAVYEFLRQNGCRWLFPGVDGEYIPMKPIEGVTYRHAPSCRHRGPCIEGALSQQILLDTIDFLPKVGMNLYMSQFLIPAAFYRRYYEKKFNTKYKPEPVTDAQLLQWKAQCEAEVAKRDIEFHDVGHGWTAAPFGVDITKAWRAIDSGNLTEETTQYLALIGGKRDLYRGAPITTQFCMSNPKARKIVADYIADYASIHSNVDYMHVWLADDNNNHCECEECIKKRPSDWYIMLMNDIDRALSERGLDTRIVFIVYNETIWAPLCEKIEKSDRFTLMLAAANRSYTCTLTENAQPTLEPFMLNKLAMPKDLDTYMGYFEKWKEMWKGGTFGFEYHFWRHQMYDLSGQVLAKRIFEDVEAYKSRDVDGLIACGSQRSYYPNGFAYYVFARKQFDLSLTYEELMEDYYSHAYGEDWRDFADYLAQLGDVVGVTYMYGRECEDKTISRFYSPTRAARLAEMPAITEKGRQLIEAHYNADHRVQTVSVRLLESHARYAELLAHALYLKATGKDEEAKNYLLQDIAAYMSEQEPIIERYFDFEMAMIVLGWIVRGVVI